jgi:putative sigma-54 modulation protein
MKGKESKMKITIIGRQMNVYEEMKLLIEKKLAKFEKFFPGEGDANVTLSCKHNQKFIEITISAAGTLFRSEVGADSFRDALDDATTNIERQIRKNKTKLAKRLRENVFVPYPEESYDDTVAEEEEIIRTKTFPIKPMSPEEAILQMNLLGHQFFVFIDDQSGATCVVYKRHDGGYGLLIPEQE